MGALGFQKQQTDQLCEEELAALMTTHVLLYLALNKVRVLVMTWGQKR